MDNIISLVATEASKVTSYDAFAFSSHFEKLTKASNADTNADLLAIYRMSAGVCGLRFQPKEQYPFMPMMQMMGKRSMIPDDLSDPELDQLAALTETNLPAAMMARLCDVLWLRRKDHVRARKAITAYLECAEKGVTEHWPDAAKSARRAARIANELGKKASERDQVRTKLLELLKAAAASPSKDEGRHWPHALAEVLVEECEGVDLAAIGLQCQLLGDGMADAWTRESYYKLAADAFKRAGLPEERKETLRRLGQCWEDDANKFRTPEGGDGMQISFRLEKAIHAYRESGDKQKAEQLLKDLQDANKLTIGQMKSIRVEVNMTDVLKQVEQWMTGKIGLQSIGAFIQLHRPESYSKAYQAATKEAQTPRIAKVVGSTSLAEEGNIVARSAGEFEATEVEIREELVKHYSLSHSIAAASLDHARKILLQDGTRAWVPAIGGLIGQSRFVPPDCRDIFSRAITAGLDGDLLLFVHLIIPQIENSVRMLVSEVGGKTTSYRDGLMKERDLNLLLTEKDPGKDGYAALGEDLLWELRAMLVEQSGPNLRNRICHGLATVDECHSSTAMYLVWLTLFLLAHFAQEKKSDAGAEGSAK